MRNAFILLGAVALLLWTAPASLSQTENKKELRLGLDECLDIALKNNHRRPVSKFAVEIAEAQHQQALSAYWPRISTNAAYMLLNRDPYNVTPAQTVNSINTAYITAWKGGPIVAGPIYSVVDAEIPERRDKLMDKETVVTSLGLQYLLFDGVRAARAKQAKSGVEAAKQEARRTDMEVIYDVKRMYYGAVLASRLCKIGQDALARLGATLELTKNLYEKGSTKVKKTDYLKNKIAVEGVRSLIAGLETNELLARAALANSMGMEWDFSVEPSETEMPFSPFAVDLKELVSDCYKFSPDWARLIAGLEAAEANQKEAKGGYLPRIGVTGSLTRIYNDYDYGVVNNNNAKNWMVMVGMELPIFDGFLTANRVREARARLGKLQEEKILLKEGLALQVKSIFLQLGGLQEQEKAIREAAAASDENRELNVRAYQEDLVETKDVIEAQITDAFMQAQHQKVLYDYMEAKSHLDFVIGEEVNKLLRQGS